MFNHPKTLASGLVFFLSVCCGRALTDSSAERTSGLSIEVCEARLTEAGKRASFKGNAMYRLQTGDDGAVISAEPISIPGFFRNFLHLEDFEQCLTRWRLHPSAEYTVIFQAGTKGETPGQWSIRIPGNGGESIRLLLPGSQS